MTQTSVLGPQGYSRPPYGDFSGKPADTGSRAGPFSTLGPGGYSRSPYASFAGKPADTGAVLGGGAGVKIFAQNFSRKRWKELLAERKKERELVAAREAQAEEDAIILLLLSHE
jgi:hypothetical protein